MAGTTGLEPATSAVTGTFPSRGFIQQQLYVKNLSIEIVNKYNGLAVLCSGWSVIKPCALQSVLVKSTLVLFEICLIFLEHGHLQEDR
jgi:hypothetical protein